MHVGSHDCSVDHVSDQTTSLCYCTRDNGNGSSGKGPEEDEVHGEGVIIRIIILMGNSEVLLRYEAVPAFTFTLVVAVSAVAHKVPHEGPDARVHDILDQNVACVLGPDTSGLEQGKPSLHEEDQERGDGHPESIHVPHEDIHLVFEGKELRGFHSRMSDEGRSV